MSAPKLGATGAFPDGRLNPADEGGIRIAITNVAGKVVIHFGKHIEWVGFNPETARRLARALMEKADAAEASRS